MIICIFILLAQTNCATLDSRHQVLEFNSDPHGVEVYDRFGKNSETTPVFRRVRRSRYHILKYDKNGKTRKKKITCPLSFGTTTVNTILGALIMIADPWAGIGTILGLTGVDLLSGNAFDCKEKIMLDVPEDADLEPCYRVAIIPPEVADQKKAFEIAKSWIARTKKYSQRCTEFVEVKESFEAHAYYNIDTSHSIQAKQLNRRVARHIAGELNANYLVELSTRDDTSNWYVKPKLYSVEENTIVSAKEELGFEVVSQLPKKGIYASQSTSASMRKILHKGVQFIPNSIGFTPFSEISFSNDFAPKQEEPSFGSTLLSSWTLSSVEHPARFRSLDATWSLYPSFGISINNFDIPTNEESSNPSLKKKLNIILASSELRIKGTIHTPIGALGLYYGFGAAAMWRSYDDGGFAKYLRPFGSGGIDYNAFITRNMFFQAGIQMRYIYKSEFYHLNDGRSEDSFVNTSVGMGYFIPVMRRWVNSVL